MTMIDYRRFETAWMPPMREPLPYFDGPYGAGFREVHQFSPVQPEYMFSPGFAAPSPYGEPMARIPRSASAMPAFGGYHAEPFMERPGPLRSSSAIPAYAYPPEVPYHDSPLSHGPVRSSSSIPSFREPRESRPPKQYKVGPEIELRVQMCCSKCEGKVKDALRKVPGVTDVITDRRAQKVTVCGKVDPQVALKQVQKTKKKADFYRKQIYSDNFINFIQSKTGRAEPEEEPELTSSYHQHVPSENGDSHHAYEDNENLSSYEEYPGYEERDHEDDSHDEVEGGFYNQHNYGQRSDMSPYGMPSDRTAEESYRTVDDSPRYESPYYSHVEPSYGVRERMPYYERESAPMYGDYGSSHAESYRPSQSYAPNQGYGPYGFANPGYMKRVIRDY
ncbi:hypothetical protein KC19_8G170900 [Ceratodon purpureus]|uniref:HMA domain-containing protein n=1 Tax=Ceratodon purpureus TaxID=3225 RepID=A0A8T0H7X2_CERPU|nr:hypothetical protein KC19_8G170900 [Ceratodon purpureus]